MWKTLRDAVTGLAEQAGIEIPGLDSAAAAVSDVTGSVGGALPDGLVAGATDATTNVTEAASGVLGESTATSGALLDAIKSHLAP